jgi:hypothetical protein
LVQWRATAEKTQSAVELRGGMGHDESGSYS